MMDIHRLSHPTAAFSSSSNGIFTNTDHILVHKRLLTVVVGVRGMVVVVIVLIISKGCENKTFEPQILRNYILEHWKISRLRPETSTVSPATTTGDKQLPSSC